VSFLRCCLVLGAGNRGKKQGYWVRNLCNLSQNANRKKPGEKAWERKGAMNWMEKEDVNIPSKVQRSISHLE